MTSGLPDFQKAIHLMGAFGRTDYMYVYEVAPWAYDSVNDRINVAIEDIGEVTIDVSDRAARLLGVVYGSQGQQLQQRAATYELLVQLVHAGVQLDPREIRALTATDIVTIQEPLSVDDNGGSLTVDGSLGRSWTLGDSDVPDLKDRAARLLGVVYGSQGQKVLQRATTYDLIVQLRSGGAEIDPRDIRALTSSDVVSVDNMITGFATSTLQGGGLPSTLDTGALRVKEQSPISGFATSGNQSTIISDLEALATLLNGGLPSALTADKLKVRASEIETLLNGGLPAALDAGALKVKEQSPLSGFATSTLQGGGLPSALDSDALKVREQNKPSTLYVGDKTIATAGNPAAIASSQAILSSVLVQAKDDNTGYVLLGNSSTQKIKMYAEDVIVVPTNNLANVYIDVSVNGEGINYIGS